MSKSGRDLLTKQQVDVLEELAAGKSNSEIARDLGVPLDAVKLDVREIMAKLDVTSPEAAIEATRPGRINRALGTVPRRSWIGGAVVALAAIGVLGIFYVAPWQSAPAEDADELRVLVAYPLAPEPGIRVADPPAGIEQDFLEELGEMFVVIWSPTGDHLWALLDFEEDDPGPYVARSLLMSYPDGNYTMLELEPGEQLSAPQWSPDGTRVAFVSDRLRMYASDGELLAEHSAEFLDVDLRAGSSSGGEHWSADSQTFMVRPTFPTRLVDREGNLLARITIDDLGADGFERGQVQWWPGRPGVLIAYGAVESDPPELKTIRLDVLSNLVIPTALDEFPEEAFDAFRMPPAELLEHIELTAPDGWTALQDVRIGHWGWGVSFEEVDRGPGAERRTLTLLRIGDISYEFESQLFLAQGADPFGIRVLGGVPSPERTVPASNIAGCPVFEDFCADANNHLALLLAGDIDRLMEFSVPVLYPCGPAGSSQILRSPMREVCAGSTSGVGRFRFPVDYGQGDEEFATLLEFRVFLGGIAARMAAARDDLSDEFGSGSPAIVSFTTRPQTPEQFDLGFANPSHVNISWIEGSGDGVERVVVGFDLRRSGIGGAVLRSDDTGRQLALTGDTVPFSEDTEIRHLLWPATSR